MLRNGGNKYAGTDWIEFGGRMIPQLRSSARAAYRGRKSATKPTDQHMLPHIPNMYPNAGEVGGVARPQANRKAELVGGVWAAGSLAAKRRVQIAIQKGMMQIAHSSGSPVRAMPAQPPGTPE